MKTWRPISDLGFEDRQRTFDLVRFGAITLRAKRVHAIDYEPEALAAKEAALIEAQKRRDAENAERFRNDPTYVQPLGVPAMRGTKPWLADVPLRTGVEELIELPPETLALLDDDAWRTGRFLHVHPEDDRCQYLLEGLEIGEDGKEEVRPAPGPVAEASETIGPSWSLYQSVAWLASEDNEIVDQQSRNFAEEVRANGNAGAVTWLRLQHAVADRYEAGAPLCRVVSACDRLSALCEAGVVRASGIPHDLGERRKIPQDDFIGAEIWPGKGGSLHRVIAGRGEAARWLQLRFSEEDVRRVNAAPSASAKPALNSKPSLRTPLPAQAIRRWNEAEMTEAISTWTSQTSSRDRDRAWREHFRAMAAEHGWDNRSFRDHWSIALGSAGQPGRPKPAR